MRVVFFQRKLLAAGVLLGAAACFSGNTAASPESATINSIAPAKTPEVTISSDRALQRKQYIAAQKALNQRQMSTYKKLIADLDGYPLTQYLEYQDIGTRLGSLPKADVSEFLVKYPDSYLSSRLLRRWLTTLADRSQWKDYIQFYSASLTDPEFACNYLRARIENGDKGAFDEVGELWNVDKSQSKACDPVFSKWIAAGKLTPELIWSRHSKALKSGNISLAAYLARQLPADDKKLAELYQEVHRKPAVLAQQSRFSAQTEHMQEVILHGLNRLAQKDALKALSLWNGYDAQQLFGDQDRLTIQHHIATRLLRQNQQDAAEKMLASASQISSVDLTEWLIRDSLRKQDWQKASEWLGKLPEEARHTERWGYWQARIMEELDIKTVDGRTAQDFYSTVAATRSFYGFLSADKLGYEYRLVDKPMLITAEMKQAVENIPGLQRARELYILGDVTNASREWFYTTRRLKTEEIVAAGRIADQWGWHRQGIQAMIDAEYWDELEVRFPLAYQEQVANAAKATSINPLLLFAIARQESAFSPDARSPAGALGLMQLMPATAKDTAKNFGIAYSNQYELLEPEKNINLGSRYLNQLLNQFNGNRILAAAAYNAGPSRVKKWLNPDEAKLPYDVWIETIPYGETRGYVQNVLSFSVIYGYRVGEKQPFITQLEAENSL